MSLSVATVSTLATLAATATAAAIPVPPTPAPQVHVLDEKDRVALQQMDKVTLSLPTEDDRVAWASPGLRVALGYGYASVFGSAPALSFRGHSVFLRPSVRLDDRWAIAVGLAYGTGPNGVRWSVTAEPTFFAWRQLSIAWGLGFGGLDITNPNASWGRQPDAMVSRDLVAGETLPRCTGTALSSLVRTEYLFVAGPLFASGPFAQLQGQWTRCQDTFGRTDNETGRPITLSQWWQQGAATLGWWLAWR